MGQRFYFDLANGQELIRDAEGVDASGPDEAKREAQAALDELRDGHEADMPGGGWQLIIRDQSGMTLKAIALAVGAFH